MSAQLTPIMAGTRQHSFFYKWLNCDALSSLYPYLTIIVSLHAHNKRDYSSLSWWYMHDVNEDMVQIARFGVIHLLEYYPFLLLLAKTLEVYEIILVMPWIINS